MYDGDSFFTLSLIGRIGLVLLSLCLSALMVWAMRALRLNLRLRAGVALIAFWLFAVFSPQIYYLYYMTLIDGLPLQWVVNQIPTPKAMLALLSFRADSTLSAQSLGLLGWCMIAAAMIRRKR